jgi:predicted Ser/Thr protein kinase
MDLFTWSFPTTGCDTIPTSVPAGAPTLSPSGTPQGSPQSNPSAPQNSPQNTPSTGGTNPDGSRSPEANIQQPNSPGGLPPTVDPVALGVGIAVPLAVLGVGAFLLVFFLRKRNKKKKETNGVNQMNPLKDIDSALPSVRPTDPGVYQNIPSNVASNNTYTSLGNVTNDTFATASATIELPDIDKRLHIPYKSLVFIKEIGAGSYGKVFLGEWRGAKVAIKVNNQITDVDGFLAEAKLTLGIAPHPNLVQTFGVSLDGPNPCIVLEYCGGGSLDQVLYDSSAVLSVEKQREYAMKIAYGLLHLHNNNIVHRDLAARNILLTNDQQPKISDFGMSRIIQEENSKGHTRTNFGPIRWMAPESLRDRSYSIKSDVWTYGIVVNEIVSRQEPHVNEDQLSLAVNIRDHAATPAISPDSDPVLVEVIHKCLKADPKDRPVRRSRCKYSIAILYL